MLLLLVGRISNCIIACSHQIWVSKQGKLYEEDVKTERERERERDNTTKQHDIAIDVSMETLIVHA